MDEALFVELLELALMDGKRVSHSGKPEWDRALINWPFIASAIAHRRRSN